MSELEQLQLKMNMKVSVVRQAIDFENYSVAQSFLDELEKDIKNVTECKNV
jgi:hypothetical protein